MPARYSREGNSPEWRPDSVAKVNTSENMRFQSLIRDMGNIGETPGEAAASGWLAATSDETWQVRNDALTGNLEPTAEVIPECYAELSAGLGEAEEGIATVAAIIAACSGADLAAGDDWPFILPMSGRSWKSTIRGIRVFDARLLFTTLPGERTASSYRCGIRPASFCSSLAGCLIL